MNKFTERDGVGSREWRLRGHRLRDGGRVPAVFLGATSRRWRWSCPACRAAVVAITIGTGAIGSITIDNFAGAGVDAAGAATFSARVVTTSGRDRR